MIKYSAIMEKDSYKVNIDKQYNDIYNALCESASKCKVFDNRISLFVFAATVGHKRKNKININNQSDNAIHCQPISEGQLSTLYSIIITDDEIGGSIDNFSNSEYLTKGLKLVEKYAQAGMKIMCEEIFEERWNGSTLSREYNDYGFEILRFIDTEINSNDF